MTILKWILMILQLAQQVLSALIGGNSLTEAQRANAKEAHTSLIITIGYINEADRDEPRTKTKTQ
jgi:hypothetical protein